MTLLSLVQRLVWDECDWWLALIDKVVLMYYNALTLIFCSGRSAHSKENVLSWCWTTNCSANLTESLGVHFHDNDVLNTEKIFFYVFHIQVNDTRSQGSTKTTKNAVLCHASSWQCHFVKKHYVPTEHVIHTCMTFPFSQIRVFVEQYHIQKHALWNLFLNVCVFKPPKCLCHENERPKSWKRCKRPLISSDVLWFLNANV